MILFLSFDEGWFAVRPTLSVRGGILVDVSGALSVQPSSGNRKARPETDFQVGPHCPKQRHHGAAIVV